MKPSPLLQTPKPSIRGKSRPHESNSGEEKNAVSKSSISSSESNAGEVIPMEPKIIIRNLNSKFNGTTADLFSPSPLDPELVLETQDLESALISSKTADSLLIFPLAVGATDEGENEEVVTIAACRSEMRKSSMDAISGWKKGKLVDFFANPIFLAKFQIVLTLLLISLIAMLHIKVWADSRDFIADNDDEGSFFHFVPT